MEESEEDALSYSPIKVLALTFQGYIARTYLANDALCRCQTGGSRVGGPELCVYADGNRRQGTRYFTQVRALLMEVKPYVLLD